MSTNALIVYEKKNGKYDCISVEYDGYIKEGVGETLHRYWHNDFDIKKLCAVKDDIRSLGFEFDDVEFYHRPNRANSAKMKNLTWDEVVEMNWCSYVYVHFQTDGDVESHWAVYDEESDDFEPLSFYL